MFAHTREAKLCFLIKTFSTNLFNYVIYSKQLYSISNHSFNFQDNYNVLHIAAMYSREDVVKLLLSKRGVDPFSTGGVSFIFNYSVLRVIIIKPLFQLWSFLFYYKIVCFMLDK